MEITNKSCFYCKFFKHLNPDDDYCDKHDCITYVDGTCPEFEKCLGEQA